MKVITATGKRKSAIARATLTAGSGKIKINNTYLDNFQPAIAQLRIKEPLLLAGAQAQKVDISVSVHGGGFMGQTAAVRLAIAKVLAEKYDKLKSVFLDYDRQLLVADVRRKEVRKPNTRGKARAKRQKSYR